MKIGVFLRIREALLPNVDARVSYSLARKIFSAVNTVEREVIPFFTIERNKIFDDLCETGNNGNKVIKPQKRGEFDERMRSLEDYELDLSMPEFKEEEFEELHVSARDVSVLLELTKKGE